MHCTWFNEKKKVHFPHIYFLWVFFSSNTSPHLLSPSSPLACPSQRHLGKERPPLPWPLASSPSCSGLGEARGFQVCLPYLRARSPTPPPPEKGWGQGAAPGASFLLLEWRVFCHPTLSFEGSFRAPDPSVQSIGKSRNATTARPSLGQAPSSLSPQAGKITLWPRHE